MIELRAVSKTLGEFKLENVNLKVEDGEYFVLLGPSGVGKTVLLELVAGLISLDKGAVLLNGKDITSLPPEQRGVALVYQDYALFPHMSVEANIAYGLRAKGISSKSAKKTVAQTAALMGVENLLFREPETLSGGEKQRVALARALIIKPNTLLLDEPLAAVDPNESKRLRHVLRDLNRTQKVTVLHVTHSADEALFLAHKVGVMLDGSVQQAGTSEEIFQQPSDARIADFLRLKNVFAVTQNTDGLCKVGKINLHVPFTARGLKHLWIRPEDILLSRDAFDSSAQNQFECVVVDWFPEGRLFDVRVMIEDQTVSALISYASFKDLNIQKNARLFATFKSSAVHVF